VGQDGILHASYQLAPLPAHGESGVSQDLHRPCVPTPSRERK